MNEDMFSIIYVNFIWKFMKMLLAFMLQRSTSV